ncbi:hypothetical protein [Cystobacter fuscus]|uniref:Nmad2 family putative nucleotide modification protein n=1 Tax=Cystobacter fuscus TaxID=43 RepID=UPI002B313761|nr:hypothetical protein F0U63_03940 [Cystobacter fuscus]
MAYLFSYCIPIDDGAAPNPFWGVCTLVICKPAIRRVAQVGDWIVGTGSRRSPIGDVATKVVYAMCVTEKLTMQAYNAWTRQKLPEKIPDWGNADHRRRLGDSIYDFTVYPYVIRKSVHDERNRERDLGGKYALLSTHFFYFGDKPIELPEDLHKIIRAGQGHLRIHDPEVVDRFIAWIEGLNIAPNSLLGEPQCRDMEKRCLLDAEEEE